MNAHGIVHKYGDHVDTDVIIPARYLNTQSHKELASHCMEDIDKDFIHRVKDGDIMVAGVNFGCGSSREHAPVAIKASGISCVIAANFARIFYRNAINIGLAILECPAASAEIENGDEVTVDFDTGVITAEAMNFMRGRSITDTWLVIDEAQNLTPRQVKGIITRVGKGTKVVLLGDPAQIDHPLLDTRSNGLTYASARMKGSPLCVQLTMLPDECERSSLALDAAMRM